MQELELRTQKQDDHPKKPSDTLIQLKNGTRSLLTQSQSGGLSQLKDIAIFINE